VTRAQLLDDWSRKLDNGILDARLALREPQLQGEPRALLEEELFVLKLARLGVWHKHTRSYLERLGITSSRRPPVLRHGPWQNSPPLRIR
jgi:hypothetical protein